AESARLFLYRRKERRYRAGRELGLRNGRAVGDRTAGLDQDDDEDRRRRHGRRHSRKGRRYSRKRTIRVHGKQETWRRLERRRDALARGVCNANTVSCFLPLLVFDACIRTTARPTGTNAGAAFRTDSALSRWSSHVERCSGQAGILGCRDRIHFWKERQQSSDQSGDQRSTVHAVVESTVRGPPRRAKQERSACS